MKSFLLFLFLFLFIVFNRITAQETLLLRFPSVSDRHLAFAYAGDIWVANKDGSSPKRLTVNPDVESQPLLSPDGEWIAFTGNYDGNIDVYIIPVTGGTPKRLTWHPQADLAKGWNGNHKIVFSSGRASNHPRYNRLFEVDVQTGREEPLILPEASQGNYSPDGKYFAYLRSQDMSEGAFKLYRGGDMGKIWIFNNQTHDVEEIPMVHSQNVKPVWIGGTVYFVSDRDNKRMNIFKYTMASKQTEQVTNFDDYDVTSLFSDGKEITFEQAGKIFLLDPASGKYTHVPVRITADIPSARPHYVSGESSIRNVNISPSGIRAVVESHGDIFTVPADKGDIRNITQTPGVHERDPAWSPDGKYIAYFSDEGGEYTLKLRDQKGEKDAVTINLGDADFYYHPVWSPDSKKIAYADKKRKLFIVDIQDKKPVEVDHDENSAFQPQINCSWSSDSRWIAYNKRLDNNLSAIFIWDVTNQKRVQVTDARSEANFPAFSRDGKYLFFTASVNFGLNTSWLDMSNYEHEVRSSIYAVVLSSKNPSLLNPQSDEETVKEDTTKAGPKSQGKKKKEKEPAKDEKKDDAKDNAVVIDFENILQRIIALPLPPKEYSGLNGTVAGQLFYLTQDFRGENFTLNSFDLDKRKPDVVLSGIDGYMISADGKKMLYVLGGKYLIAGVPGKVPPGEGQLKTGDIKLFVDPQKEWHQMFDEIWRIERDFFYVENLHGINLEAVKKKYSVFLPYVAHRNDLNYLFREMLGELVIGHMFVGGGDYPPDKKENIGLLGADYEINEGHYRINKIYSGLNWNPGLQAPLTQPGIHVKEGEYLVAVNGVPLDATKNIYSLFENTAGLQTRISVNSKPSMDGAHEEIVVPVPNEQQLRLMNWVEGNRKKVDELSGGKIAYVYMPDTGGDGFEFFNRYYFSQLDKQGVIVDERFNGGGSAADYVIDLLSRTVINYFNKRDGKPYSTPGALIDGPKVMITNSYAASGGDLMPYMFQQKKIGKLVGTTTYGILIGITGYPALMDGGFVTAPSIAIFSKDGKWVVENEGVHPDIEVENYPKEVIAGHDPQLERAVEEVLKQVQPKKELKEPAAPVKSVVK
jgi:tricorn protease